MNQNSQSLFGECHHALTILIIHDFLRRKTPYEEEFNTSTEFRVAKQDLPKDCIGRELLSMTWKLCLGHERTRREMIDKEYHNNPIKLTPQIELELDADVVAKLGDVWIAVRKTLYVNGKNVPIKIIAKCRGSEGSLD